VREREILLHNTSSADFYSCSNRPADLNTSDICYLEADPQKLQPSVGRWMLRSTAKQIQRRLQRMQHCWPVETSEYSGTIPPRPTTGANRLSPCSCLIMTWKLRWCSSLNQRLWHYLLCTSSACGPLHQGPQSSKKILQISIRA
jgi:hypothetical protein